MILSGAIALCYLIVTVVSKLPRRDCYVGDPPFCNNSLASDSSCRGLEVSNIDGWKRMDCDYVLYSIPAKERITNKWIVIHAGGCDLYTEALGDFFSVDMQYNIYGLRPCGGVEDSDCAAKHDFNICSALHISFLFPELHPTTIQPDGYGLNPPALVNIYHTPNTTMLFLHEYGDTDEYNWFAANGCTTQKPLHMCIAAIDPDYRHKFQAIKVILEQAFSYTSWFPCKLEVIDSMLIEADATPDIPCSGILRPVKDPWRVGVVPDGAPNWQWEMPSFQTRAIQLAADVEPHGPFIDAFRAAMEVALCKSFGPNQTTCLDGEPQYRAGRLSS